ncbi:MAG: hypothetical protein MRERV_21c024 [Mycoplasmataceae bacterium RV_VA103A]|nr:MAG: hypothetical protein MRERV_21c024 [Mycoplasmataceae bacterium RV_VA103A]
MVNNTSQQNIRQKWIITTAYCLMVGTIIII